MAYEIDEETLYYFLCPFENNYYNLFLGMLRPELVQAFKQLDSESGRAMIRVNIGAHQFISLVDRPVFVVEYEKDSVYEFAGDDDELVLFDDKDMEEYPELPQSVFFPSYFTKGIEPSLDYMLGKEFCVNDNGVWVPLDIV